MIVECFSKTDGIEIQRRRFKDTELATGLRINPQIGFSHVIERIFRTYQQDGVQVIDLAIMAEQGEIAGGSSTVKGVPRQEVIRILQVYRDRLRRPMLLETVQQLSPRDLWHDYSQSF